MPCTKTDTQQSYVYCHEKIIALSLIDAVRVVCGRVYVTVRCPSIYLAVCLSVCLSHPSTAAAACGGFAAVGPAERRCRSIAAADNETQQHGGQQQMRAVSRCQLTQEVEDKLVLFRKIELIYLPYTETG